MNSSSCLSQRCELPSVIYKLSGIVPVHFLKAAINFLLLVFFCTAYASADTSTLSEEERERKRLALREQSYDPDTRDYLSNYVKEGFHCLELGPGLGSIARWLAKTVGDNGRVDTIDLQDRLENKEQLGNLSIKEMDIGSVDLQANTYDLIFARDVIMHIRSVPVKELVNRLSTALRPGGYLIFEEGGEITGERFSYAYYQRSKAVGELVDNIVSRINSSQMMDFSLAHKHPVWFQQSGLTVVDARRLEKWISGGGSELQMLELTVQQLEGRVINESEKETLNQLYKIMQDTSFGTWNQGETWITGMKPKANEKSEF